MDGIGEELLVILSTVLSLLTAWSWRTVLQYIEAYYGYGFKGSLFVAVLLTVVTLLLINWMIRNLNLQKEKIDKVRRTILSTYVGTQ